MDSLLEVRGLCKYLDGNIVLGSCSFTLAPGHITGLLGPVVGALVHNAGSVLVIVNSALLLRWKKRA